jgi:hypothetical protein
MDNPGKPRLSIPAYDLALRAFLNQVAVGIVGIDPWLGSIRSRQTGHAGPTRHITEPSPLDHPLTHFEREFRVHGDIVRNTDVEEFLPIILKVVDEYVSAIGSTFVDIARDITDATGNTIDAGGRPLSWDVIIDGLEQKEIAFDKDGRMNETLVMNPKTAALLASIEMTPAQTARLERVLQKKRDQWDAKQRTRRLSRPSEGTAI